VAFLLPITASWPPTSTVLSSGAVIASRVPATGDGISVSTLSVDTSSSASSSSTWSPTCLSHLVTVPSVTLSPSAGMVTGVPPADGGWSAGGGAGAGSAVVACAGSGSAAGSGSGAVC